MAISWEKVEQRHQELAHKLADSTLDQQARATLAKEFSHLDVLLQKHNQLKKITQQMQSTHKALQESSDPEMAQLFKLEEEELKEKYDQVQDELDQLLYPPNQLDNRSVYLEIRAGTGGQEAALFAADLMGMYTAYALRKGWKVAIDSASPTDLGGFREVILHIQGKDVFGHLKHESGVHRVQRIPSTETAGRVHTSTATVAVLPEADEVDVSINPADLRIDVYRSSGAGGQHVNTTDSAVRITHIPTGFAVACQEERSQHKNKAKALKLLQSRLLAMHMQKQKEQMSQARKEQVGTGERAEKVRTYNFPQNRITDHQVDLTLKKLDMVLKGDLDEIIQALRQKERQDQRAAVSF